MKLLYLILVIVLSIVLALFVFTTFFWNPIKRIFGFGGDDEDEYDEGGDYHDDEMEHDDWE